MRRLLQKKIHDVCFEHVPVIVLIQPDYVSDAVCWKGISAELINIMSTDFPRTGV